MERWRVEPHCHTNASPCSTLQPEKLIQLAKDRKIDALAITDHDEIENAKNIRETAPFFVIVGEEVTTKDGDITALFIEERIPPGLSAEETIERIRAQNGIVVIPHPCDTFRKHAFDPLKYNDILPLVDAIEVWNARNILRSSNTKAHQLAEKYGKLKFAGSDAHTKVEVGKSGMEMAPFQNAQEFLTSLQDAKLIERKNSIFVHGITKVKKVWLKIIH